ncbi:MAG: Serine--tRNA ligase, mitochondrial [Alyxoria varia]|nr:MAG: Serine--tRNA ligase, mitochondrial [Alyxoria varia]
MSGSTWLVRQNRVQLHRQIAELRGLQAIRSLRNTDQNFKTSTSKMNTALSSVRSPCVFCRFQIGRSRQKGFIDKQWRRQYFRPTTAPSPTLDIKHIAQNPGLYAHNCIDRNWKSHADSPWRVLELRKKRSDLQHEAASLRKSVATIEKMIAQLNIKKNNKELDHSEEMQLNIDLPNWLNQAAHAKAELERFKSQEDEIEKEMADLALSLPNLSGSYTPTEADKVLIHVYNRETTSTKSHVDIGSELELLDFTGAAKSSGWGSYFLDNEAEILEHALVQYALQVASRHQWKRTSPPCKVYSHNVPPCGFQPRDQGGEQQVYHIEQPEKERGTDKPSFSLAGTAEIPLAARYSESQLELQSLPLKLVGASRCFRAEAGARGADTKGLYRVHEFTKVEMFAWTLPDAHSVEENGKNFRTQEHDSVPISQSTDIFDEMIDIQREILSSLGLSFRVMEMSAPELGASASRKIDIEVLFPSRNKINEGWGEVTSASICTDYQSRRLATRFKQRDGKLGWPYSVNGTALAVPRVLAAILETHWDGDAKGVHVPEVLWPWMDGVKTIRRESPQQKTSV